MRPRFVVPIVAVLLAVAARGVQPTEAVGRTDSTPHRQVVELSFKQPSAADSGESKTLHTLVKVRGISEQYSTGGLYLMTEEGDFEDLLRHENQRALEVPFITESWRWCSIFATKNKDSVIVGRNWDNQNVGSIIVTLYRTSRGYSSISIGRAIDMGFPLNVDLVDDVLSTPFAGKLLLAPFYAYDGMNDQGVVVTVTGVNQVKVGPEKDKEQIFVSYLVRKMLDQAKTVDEAVKLAEGYVPFDLDKGTLCSHLLVADATGRSVILEYGQKEWHRTYPAQAWQVMTNSAISGVPEVKLREGSRRYKSLSETLENTRGEVDWEAGMQMLRDVSQKGTTWSVIYRPVSRDFYLSVYQSWDRVYHLRSAHP
jgi:hypothetical protein